MSSEKPKTGMKPPHNKPHVPEEAKQKKKHRLRNAALGLAAAVGIGGLAAGCAPSARAQDTTPRARTEVVQSPETRVAPATALTPPRREVRVAEAPSANARGYASTAAGPDPDVTEVSQQEVLQVLVPLFGSSNAYERDISTNPPTNWVVEANRGPLGTDVLVTMTVYANTPDGKVEVKKIWAQPNFKIYEIPTTETTTIGAGIFVIIDNGSCNVFYFDKNAGDYKQIVFGPNRSFIPNREIMVAVNILPSGNVNMIVANTSSFTVDRHGGITGVAPGSLILMNSILLSEPDGSGAPQASVALIQVED